MQTLSTLRWLIDDLEWYRIRYWKTDSVLVNRCGHGSLLGDESLIWWSLLRYGLPKERTG